MLRPCNWLLPLVLVVGCGSDSTASTTAADYHYGLPEMQKAVVGDYAGTLTPSGKAPTAVTLHLDYAPPAPKPACGSRVLCIDESEIGLVGKFDAKDGSYTAAAVTGTFQVFGTELSSGNVSVRLPDGLTFSLPFASGALGTSASVIGPGGEAGMLTLTKMP